MNIQAEYKPFVFWYAVLTVCVALVAIVVGALVTTKNAGMAFRDWPTSDGHNLFLYPWLQSAGDKFLEHGHRLAGSLIGMVSIGLALVVWKKDSRSWVRWTAFAVLGCVILQGILGGTRVLFDRQLLAMFHGTFGAMVLSLMAAVALFASKSWINSVTVTREQQTESPALGLKILAGLLPLTILSQYLLGGFLRHLGSALFEHMGLAVLVLILGILMVVKAHQSRNSWIKRPAWLLLLLMLGQISLGAGAFVTKFGFKSTGYVAVQHSINQVIFRTSHTVIGMLVLLTSVILALRVYRVVNLTKDSRNEENLTPMPQHLSLKGGAV